MFLYKISGGEARVLACDSRDTVIHVPEAIEGCPVTELSAYAFSQGRGRRQMLLEEGFDTDEERLCGPHLEELYLPGTLRRIGNYAFYNCYELRSIHCSSAITDLGSGLFTGCTRVKYIDIRIVEGMRSCFKEMLSELRQELYVTYREGKDRARLIFPEMYEESVENTPARIIIREMHGCGHLYRYCFEQTDFQFKRYDSLFLHAQVNEPELAVTGMAAWRLQCPLGLYDSDRQVYEAYMREHLTAAASWYLMQKDEEGLVWLTEHYVKSADEADRLIELVSGMEATEGLSFLMDFKHRNYGVQKKRFSL